MFNKLIEKLEKFGNKAGSVKSLTVIKNAFSDVLPIIIIGSLAAFFNNVIFSPKNGLAQFGGFEFLAQFGSIFAAITYATMNLLSVYLVFRVGYHASTQRNLNPNIGGLIALASFVILVPTTIQFPIDGGSVAVPNVLSASYTNAQGMFLALIIGNVSMMVLGKLMSVKLLQLKMPESVPSGIADAFAVVLPASLLFVILGLINFIFIKVTGSYFADILYTVLQQPLELLMQQPWGVVVLAMICSLLWLVGIHGSNMVGVVKDTIGITAIAANMVAFQANAPLPNIFTYTFWNTYVTIGGSGNTLGLLIAIFIVSKRDDVKSIAKLSLIPGLFGINEPLIFGLPIVLNPILAIPFILAPVAGAAIGYIATALNFAKAAYITVPFTVPPVINGFLSTGSLGTVITQIVVLVVSVLIYLPFVKAMNKEKV